MLLTLHPDKTGPMAEAAGGEQGCGEAFRIAFAAYEAAKAGGLQVLGHSLHPAKEHLRLQHGILRLRSVPLQLQAHPQTA